MLFKQSNLIILICYLTIISNLNVIILFLIFYYPILLENVNLCE
jgi:hypothetical protein